MDDRGWYMRDCATINTADETITKLKEEEEEMATK